MSFRQDISTIAEKEGFSSSADFIFNYIINESWTFLKLKKYLETKYKRYYSRSTVYNIGCQILRESKLISDECHCGFKYLICDLQWQRRAKKLGFKTVKEMFEAYERKSEILADKLNLDKNTIWSVKKRIKNK